MLTAEMIIGSVVGFIVEKALSKVGFLTGNNRRTACRSLTKLYYSVQALDDVTENIFHTLNGFRSTSTGEAYALMNALNNHMHEVALASNMFIDLGQELHAGLEIIDPALAVCCVALYVSKFDFLHEMSNTVEWDRSATPGRIVVKMPTRTTNELTMDRAYADALDAYKRGEKHYWPDTWNRTDGPDQVILSWEDHDSATAFIVRLTEHRAVLVKAKEKLRELLKSSFTVDELLFQTNTHPHR